MPELADWEREALAKLHAPLPTYALVPEKTALVVLDMQYLDAHPDYGLGHLFAPYFERCAAAAPDSRKHQPPCQAQRICDRECQKRTSPLKNPSELP